MPTWSSPTWLPDPLRRRVRAAHSGLMRKGYISALAKASQWGRHLPIARRAFAGVRVEQNLRYGSGRDQVFDLYRPSQLTGPAPVVLYIHGGAFTDLSKDTHWMMGLAFAHAGYIVCNINYRLAPEHPFPAAIEDSLTALGWVHEHIRSYGGDPARIVVAGESAGGNLATATTLACSHPFALPAAQAVFAAEVRPVACIAACGILQVTNTGRLSARRRRPLPTWVQDQLASITREYLPVHVQDEATLPLVDPLVFLEDGPQTARELPPFFAFVGTRDPLLDDTRRLQIALDQRNIACTSKIYPGEIHAFHAMLPRAGAQECWRDQFAWLGEVLGETDRSRTLRRMIRTG